MLTVLSYAGNRSLPSRERGLKSAATKGNVRQSLVAPFTGAWIEMITHTRYWTIYPVAPFTGAWIEIAGTTIMGLRAACRSLHGSVD